MRFAAVRSAQYGGEVGQIDTARLAMGGKVGLLDAVHLTLTWFISNNYNIIMTSILPRIIYALHHTFNYRYNI